MNARNSCLYHAVITHSAHLSKHVKRQIVDETRVENKTAREVSNGQRSSEVVGTRQPGELSGKQGYRDGTHGQPAFAAIWREP